MNKENLRNQSEDPHDLIIINSDEKLRVKEAAGQIENAIQEIEGASDSAMLSNEKIKKEFSSQPLIVDEAFVAQLKIDQAKLEAKNSILSLIRKHKLSPYILAGTLSLLAAATINEYDKYSRKFEIENIYNNELEDSSSEEEAEANPEPKDYDLSLICDINERDIERQALAASDSNLAEEIIKNELIKTRLNLIKIEIAKKDSTKAKNEKSLNNLANQKLTQMCLNQLKFEMSFYEDAVAKYKTDSTNVKTLKYAEEELAKLQKEKDLLISGKQKVRFDFMDFEIIDRAEALLKAVDLAKKQVIKTIKSPGYIQKLMKEFGVGAKKALEHQQVRIKNVNNAKINFRFPEDIKASASGAYAYFKVGTNLISIPIDAEVDDFFMEALRHELFHLLNNGGTMSPGSLKIFNETFSPKKGLDSPEIEFGNDYYGDPTERYVRMKNLTIDLVDMGFMENYGSKFTKEVYHQMMELFNKDPNAFQSDSQDFIRFTLGQEDPEKYTEKAFESFRRMFDDIAVNQKKPEGNTYYNPGWDYNGLDKIV
ncbi:MAG: hypothetical protein ACOYMB_04640 [Patescibacteria group bacterium]